MTILSDGLLPVQANSSQPEPTELSVIDRQALALRFLKMLFALATHGFVSLWCKDPRKFPRTVVVPTCGHIPVSDLQEVARKAVAVDSDGYKKSIYFGCGVREKNLGAFHRGGAKDVLSIPGLWLDLDVAGPGHQAENLPPDEGAALALLSPLPEPTLIVHSGGGLQVWWLFAAPVIIGTGMVDVEALLRDLQAWVAAEAAKQGYHVDDTADLARVLRLPGCHNFKIPGRPRLVRLVKDDGPRHSPEALRAAIPSREDAPEGQAKRTPGRRRRAAAHGGKRRGPRLDPNYIHVNVTGDPDTFLRQEIDALRHAAKGTRNATLNAVAYYLGRFVGCGALQRDVVHEQLLGAAREIGLDDQEALPTIKSGLSSGIARPHDLASVGK